MNWHALLPFKANGQSKQRLDLPRAECNLWAERWLQHALDCCRECPLIGSMTVVTLGDEISVPAGVGWYRQQQAGLNEGLAEAYARERPGRCLILLPDLPDLTARDLSLFLEGCPDPGVVLAPDRHGKGCNALAFQSCALPPLLFGPDSLRRFEQAVPARRLSLPNLAADVDTLADWKTLCP